VNATPRYPHRLRRLGEVWIDGGLPRYFITICVAERNNVLANDVVYSLLVVFLLGSPKRYRWWPKRFVVMPDHLHLIVQQGNNCVSLGQWIKAMKSFIRSSRGHCRPGDRTGRQELWRWQTGFFDHVLRNDESESEKWNYVLMNPVRAGLAERPEDWPYGSQIVYDENGPRLISST